jgi:hypothetical protein
MLIITAKIIGSIDNKNNGKVINVINGPAKNTMKKIEIKNKGSSILSLISR